MKEYAKDFPDNMVWLTGDLEQVPILFMHYVPWWGEPLPVFLAVDRHCCEGLSVVLQHPL